MSEPPIPIILSLTALSYLSGCRLSQPVVITPTSDLPPWLHNPPVPPTSVVGAADRHCGEERWAKSSRCDYESASSTAM